MSRALLVDENNTISNVTNLSFNGVISTSTNVCSAIINYTAGTQDNVILVSNAASITLYESSGSRKILNIKNISNVSSTIIPSGTDNIDGINANVSSLALTNTTLIDASSGNWYIL